ncbi:hypothetical protein KCU99_g77, partial [Aureobasidium melanogenum]
MNTRAQQQRRPSSVVSKTSTPNESKPQPHPKTLVPYASDTQVAEHGIRIFVVCIAAAVVCIHTEIMTQTMGQKQSRNSAVEEFFLVSTSKNAQTAQPISLLSFVNFPCRGYCRVAALGPEAQIQPYACSRPPLLMQAPTKVPMSSLSLRAFLTIRMTSVWACPNWSLRKTRRRRQERQARPDDIFRVDRRDEQSQIVVLDIVSKIRVRNSASREVEEESTLAGRESTILSNELSHTPGMCLGGVFARWWGWEVVAMYVRTDLINIHAYTKFRRFNARPPPCKSIGPVIKIQKERHPGG